MYSLHPVPIPVFLGNQSVVCCVDRARFFFGLVRRKAVGSQGGSCFLHCDSAMVSAVCLVCDMLPCSAHATSSGSPLSSPLQWADLNYQSSARVVTDALA